MSPDEPTDSKHSIPRLILWTVASTVALLAALEIWRPYYFLTDDNFSVGLPFLTEMGRHLKSGQSPFYSDYLYGGHYNLLRDANYFSWSPVNFAVSLLADTSLRFEMLDIIGWLNMLIAATGFALLGATLRRDLALDVGNGRLLFLTLSFTFSTFVLTTGPSWVNFLANQSVLPWLALGLWLTNWRWSMGLLVFFSLHQALSGQSAGTISNGITLTLFAILMAYYRRSWTPIVRWLIANAVTLVLILPVLIPALGGFMHSIRGEGITVESMHKFAMPAALAPVSFLFGNVFEMAANLAHLPQAAAVLFVFPRMPTLLACAAAWCIFPLVCQRRRWTLLEAGCGAMMVLLLIMVVRPLFITEAMAHLPILRSMRWPFREILQLLFFYHLLLVLRPWAGSPRLQNRIACISLGIFALPLYYTAPLTLNGLDEDRGAVVFSNIGDHFWAGLRANLKPGEMIATVVDPKAWYYSLGKVPYSLIGTADFPAFYGVRCISGYSQTVPLDQVPVKLPPYFWFGAYAPEQVPFAKFPPNVRIIRVYSFHPLRVKLLPATPDEEPVDMISLLAQ